MLCSIGFESFRGNFGRVLRWAYRYYLSLVIILLFRFSAFCDFRKWIYLVIFLVYHTPSVPIICGVILIYSLIWRSMSNSSWNRRICLPSVNRDRSVASSAKALPRCAEQLRPRFPDSQVFKILIVCRIRIYVGLDLLSLFEHSMSWGKYCRVWSSHRRSVHEMNSSKAQRWIFLSRVLLRVWRFSIRCHTSQDQVSARRQIVTLDIDLVPLRAHWSSIV